QVLIMQGSVTEDELEAALEAQRATGERIGRILVDEGVITEIQLVQALAAASGADFVDLSERILDPTAARPIPEPFAPRSHADTTADAPVVQFVNELLTRAVHERASDIHLEPTGGSLRVRFRVDGVTHDVMNVPRQLQAPVISRLKIMGDINIAEHRLPQDGRVTMSVESRAVDIRMVTLPTAFGEAFVLRLLDRDSALRPISDLGFIPEPFESYTKAYNEPYGAILVTGPTGSGKSSTLYATLNEINDPGRTIVTVEDPIEYRMPGIKQVQLNMKAGLTFASALRSILRADPDVVLV